MKRHWMCFLFGDRPCVQRTWPWHSPEQVILPCELGQVWPIVDGRDPTWPTICSGSLSAKVWPMAERYTEQLIQCLTDDFAIAWTLGPYCGRMDCRESHSFGIRILSPAIEHHVTHTHLTHPFMRIPWLRVTTRCSVSRSRNRPFGHALAVIHPSDTWRWPWPNSKTHVLFPVEDWTELVPFQSNGVERQV